MPETITFEEYLQEIEDLILEDNNEKANYWITVCRFATYAFYSDSDSEDKELIYESAAIVGNDLEVEPMIVINHPDFNKLNNETLYELEYSPLLSTDDNDIIYKKDSEIDQFVKKMSKLFPQCKLVNLKALSNK